MLLCTKCPISYRSRRSLVLTPSDQIFLSYEILVNCIVQRLKILTFTWMLMLSPNTKLLTLSFFVFRCGAYLRICMNRASYWGTIWSPYCKVLNSLSWVSVNSSDKYLSRNRSSNSSHDTSSMTMFICGKTIFHHRRVLPFNWQTTMKSCSHEVRSTSPCSPTMP